VIIAILLMYHHLLVRSLTVFTLLQNVYFLFISLQSFEDLSHLRVLNLMSPCSFGLLPCFLFYYSLFKFTVIPNSALRFSKLFAFQSLFGSTKKKKFRGVSPRVNYTDRATASCRRR
jgi:hypothetical protein